MVPTRTRSHYVMVLVSLTMAIANARDSSIIFSAIAYDMVLIAWQLDSSIAYGSMVAPLGSISALLKMQNCICKSLKSSHGV